METKRIVLAFAGAVTALLAFGTAVKYLQVQKASRWKVARGRILTSNSDPKKMQRTGSSPQREGTDFEIRNFARITCPRNFIGNGELVCAPARAFPGQWSTQYAHNSFRGRLRVRVLSIACGCHGSACSDRFLFASFGGP